MEKIRHQIVEVVKRAQSILIMPSAPVDGDSLGSSLALYLVLKKLGKEVTVVCADPVPEAFRFLPTTTVISDDFSAANDFIVTLDCHRAKLKTIRTKLEQDKVNIILTAKKGQFSSKDVSFHHGPSRYDLIITVDTGDLMQLGRFYEDNPEMFVNVPLINIDHHASNSHFGKLNYVDMMSSATTELLIPLVQDFEKDSGMNLMDEDIATLLLAGIVTDTGSFQNANTTPRSFAAAAQLIKYGARQQEIIQHVFKTKKLSTLRLWGRILSKITVDQKYRIAWSTITAKDLKETGSQEDETGGIIDELMTNAPGVDVVLILKQKKDRIVSGSLRTPNVSIDASAIAEMFGGGGHIQAAGFKIESDNVEETEKMVLLKIRDFQAKRLNIVEEEPARETPSVEGTVSLPKEVSRLAVPSKLASSHAETVIPNKVTESHVSTQMKPGKEVHRETRKPSENAGDQNKSAADSFTDVIMKRAITGGEEAEIEPGITYRFED